MLLSTFKLKSSDNSAIALMAGIELPTGENKISSINAANLVVGSGSFDPMLGNFSNEKLE